MCICLQGSFSHSSCFFHLVELDWAGHCRYPSKLLSSLAYAKAGNDGSNTSISLAKTKVLDISYLSCPLSIHFYYKLVKNREISFQRKNGKS